MNKEIGDMSLIEIFNYIKFVYGNDETTNLYIRCLDCDKMIPIYEWDENEQIIEFELCKDCGGENNDNEINIRIRRINN